MKLKKAYFGFILFVVITLFSSQITTGQEEVKNKKNDEKIILIGTEIKENNDLAVPKSNNNKLLSDTSKDKIYKQLQFGNTTKADKNWKVKDTYEYTGVGEEIYIGQKLETEKELKKERKH